MAQSESKKLFEAIFRVTELNGVIDFDDLLRKIIPQVLGLNGISIDEYIEKKRNRLWNYFNKSQKTIFQFKKCTPAYKIVSEDYKRIDFSPDIFFKRNPLRKRMLLKSKPFILRKIDTLSARQYEALACVTLKALGAQEYLLTPNGNEAGIDFIASIDFGVDAHYIFGTSGPLRVIGQCKKYGSECQVNTLKEFNQTLSDVYHLTDKVKKILPSWFRSGKRPIIGWVISHSGFQTGAFDRAKNYGILISDSKSIAEILSTSRRFNESLPEARRAENLKELTNEIIKE